MTPPDRTPFVVAIDAGKTKFLAGVFTESAKEVERHRIEVTAAGETLAALNAYLAGVFTRYPVESIGLSSFGPLETNAGRADFGAILGSSEPQWSGVNLPSLLSSRFRVPVSFDFDVNAGAWAEKCHRVDEQAGLLYLSLGTGIGGSLHGPGTEPPQLGHLSVPREHDDPYPGSCRFHRDCFQGLASGRALADRWGIPAHELPASHEAWDLQARYVARACANLLYSSACTAVRVGSGISQVPGLIERSDRYLREFMNGFPETLWRRIDETPAIQRAATAPDSSFIGAALLASKKEGWKFLPGNATPKPDEPGEAGKLSQAAKQ